MAEASRVASPRQHQGDCGSAGCAGLLERDQKPPESRVSRLHRHAYLVARAREIDTLQNLKAGELHFGFPADAAGRNCLNCAAKDALKSDEDSMRALGAKDRAAIIWGWISRGQ
jgi:hypothetical protein